MTASSLWRSRAAPWLVALAGGVLWGLQFGPEGFVLAPWVALAPVFFLLGSRRPLLTGWVHGIATWLTAIPWIAPTLITFGQVPGIVGLLGLVLLAAYLGFYHGVFVWLGRRLWDRGGITAWLGLPALWVLLEVARGIVVTGFPWNLAAYAWIEVPGALPAASWLGVYGLSLVVVSMNLAVARAIARRRSTLAAGLALVVCVGLAVADRLALPRPVDRDADAARGGVWLGHEPGPIGQPVRVIQPNIPNLVEPDWPIILENYRRLVDLSREACAEAPGALIVWPESAAWPYAYGRNAGLDSDLAALNRQGCPVLFNSPLERLGGGTVASGDGASSGWTNSVLLLSPGAPPEQYDKRHLVPFGEYNPLAGLLPFVDSLARNAGDFSPGEGVRLLRWGREEVGMALCFEVVFSREVAAATRRGATVLATLTNDAWYGDTAAPWQHLRAARFRAAESRRPLIRAAITGVSALIRPDGSVAASLGVGEEGVLRGRVVGGRALSPATRWPWAPAIASSGLLLLSLGWYSFGPPKRP